MQIHNRQTQALTSSITPAELGQAMQQLDLTSIPPHRRKAAIRDHLMRIMADTIHDRTKAFEIHASRILRQQKA